MNNMWNSFSRITAISLIIMASACGGDANDQTELDQRPLVKPGI